MDTLSCPSVLNEILPVSVDAMAPASGDHKIGNFSSVELIHSDVLDNTTLPQLIKYFSSIKLYCVGR
ncbi:hypothetical protein ADUPG1_009318 [Aduncisulcus paluster]|uniref:Uncharacterized protein n=1 Tax=Aduncisulcus paluster TaxID=2918883 RepID=A0ABQ5KV77_9EUKA|nr:hypothetical protein ADUPG1_009318 [Aduncisulcus paluster]